MSAARTIHIPFSGCDRRHYTRELRKAVVLSELLWPLRKLLCLNVDALLLLRARSRLVRLFLLLLCEIGILRETLQAAPATATPKKGDRLASMLRPAATSASRVLSERLTPTNSEWPKCCSGAAVEAWGADAAAGAGATATLIGLRAGSANAIACES
jgi:hypothetical protein